MSSDQPRSIVSPIDQAGYLRVMQEARHDLLLLQSYRPSKVARVETLHELNFARVVPLAERVVEIYKQVNPFALDLLPTAMLMNFSTDARDLLARLKDFEEVDLKSVAANQQQYNSRVSDFANGLSRAVEQLSPLIALSIRTSKDIDRLESAAAGLLKANSDIFARKQTQLDEMLGTAQSNIDAARAAIADAKLHSSIVVAEGQADHFGKAAADHSKAAGKWLVATCIASGVLLVVAILGLFLHKLPGFTPNGAFEIASVISAKMVFVSAIAYGVYFCARNYMSHSHNKVVCRHRQNALMTYGAMARAANDFAQRDAILSKAADSIFSPQPTGYTKADGGEPAAISMIAMAPNALRSAAGQQQ